MVRYSPIGQMPRGATGPMLVEMSSFHEISTHLASTVEGSGASVLRLVGARTPSCATAWSADVAITAAHGLGRRDSGHVILPGGERAEAQVIGRDPGTDLALLRVQADLAPPTWATDLPEVGQLVLALGRGKDGGARANLGMVSGVSGSWRTRRGGTIDHYIEIDGSLGAGLSGGPLASADGRLLGINTHRFRRGGVTIPAATVRRVAEHLEKHGSFRRGFLGVGSQPVQLPVQLAQDVGRRRGLLVTAVAAGSPAALAGVLLGDVILALGANPIEGLADLLAALGDEGGRTASLELWRAGASHQVDVALAAS